MVARLQIDRRDDTLDVDTMVSAKHPFRAHFSALLRLPFDVVLGNIFAVAH